MFVHTRPSKTRPKNSSLPKKVPPLPKKPAHKSAQKTSKKRNANIVRRYVVSEDQIGAQIEKQRKQDLLKIKKSIALQHYYETLMSLFMLMHSSSQIIASNIFQCRKQETGLAGVKFIGFLLGVFEKVWHERNIRRLKLMASNMLKMGPTPKIFEQKIQFIARKITLNHNMKNRIEMAFLNIRLQSFWGKLLKQIRFTTEIEMLEEMYELPPQKIAYWDFARFLNNYLTNQSFTQEIKELSKKQHAKERPHNFSYEFLVIEIFCFHEEEEDNEGEPGRCQLI